MKIKEILGFIEEDIKHQESKLTGDFEHDKPIQWRIVGMKNVRDKITQSSPKRIREVEINGKR